MITRYGFFSFLLVFVLAGLPAAGQTGILGNDPAYELAAIDCRELLQPFPEVSFVCAPTNELSLELLVSFDTRLTPYDNQETELDNTNHSHNKSGLQTAGITLAFTGLGILGVTGIVYVTEYLLQLTCKLLNTCTSVSGAGGFPAPGSIGNLPYLIALSVGGGVTLIGLIFTVCSI